MNRKYNYNFLREVARAEVKVAAIAKIVAIKEKQIPIINKNMYRPGQVIGELNGRGHKRTLN